MATIINLIYLIVMTGIGFSLLYRNNPVTMRLAFDPMKRKMKCTGLEALLIFIIATGLMGLLPVLSIHLAILEIICIIGITRAPYNVIYSWPIKLFIIFLAWAFIGILYSPSTNFGIRMMLKYIYPLLVALLASAVIRDVEVFLKAGQYGRWVAVISFIAKYLPMSGFIFLSVFWNDAALATNYTTWVVFSLALAYAGISTKKNIYWTLAFILPCVLWVFRTNIFGTSIALSTFFFIKYKLKSLPLILLMACVAVCAIFYIPSVKKKMYFRPDEVSITDFLTGNVEEDNLNTSGRNEMWKKVNPFYEDHPMIGSGTGRVQKYFYTEITGFGRGGQLHNDLLLIKCDNGLIGLILFLLSYLAIMFHCLLIYHKSQLRSVKLCSIVAGSALMGILVTTYSDNTVSYSMATLSYPWAFYGMALGLMKREKEAL